MKPDPCNAPIRDRQGEPLGFNCNLPKGHLGKHVETYEPYHEMVDQAEEPHDPEAA